MIFFFLHHESRTQDVYFHSPAGVCIINQGSREWEEKMRKQKKEGGRKKKKVLIK